MSEVTHHIIIPLLYTILDEDACTGGGRPSPSDHTATGSEQRRNTCDAI